MSANTINTEASVFLHQKSYNAQRNSFDNPSLAIHNYPHLAMLGGVSLCYPCLYVGGQLDTAVEMAVLS